MDFTIRIEEKSDYWTVENLVRNSFWNVYRPGCTEHYVLHCLRSSESFVQELSFVMEAGGKIIGQNVFVRARIAKSDGDALPVLSMGPICIADEYRRQGYGRILLDHTLNSAAKAGAGAVFLEGDIAFYGRSGFVKADQFGIKYHGLPDGAEADFFLCRELRPGFLSGLSGVYATPKIYFAAEENQAAFEAFDSKFPFKEKLKLPGQLS